MSRAAIHTRPRAVLISELRQRLERDESPRMTMFTIVALAGAAAFLASVVTLNAGVERMAIRYGLAVIAGYAAFLALIRGWIALRRDDGAADARLPDLTDIELGDLLSRRAPAPAPVPPFGGGRSGGAGGGVPFDEPVEWDPARDGPIVRGGGGGSGSGTGRGSGSGSGGIGSSLGLDGDELAWLLVALVAAFGGVACVAYVIYTAPLLLAEVALDAALISSVYRRLRTQDVEHWTDAVFRHTWMPSLLLLIFMMTAGFALQQIAPDARSIGGVVKSLSGADRTDRGGDRTDPAGRAQPANRTRDAVER